MKFTHFFVFASLMLIPLKSQATPENSISPETVMLICNRIPGNHSPDSPEVEALYDTVSFEFLSALRPLEKVPTQALAL